MIRIILITIKAIKKEKRKEKKICFIKKDTVFRAHQNTAAVSH